MFEQLRCSKQRKVTLLASMKYGPWQNAEKLHACPSMLPYMRFTRHVLVISIESLLAGMIVK